MLGVHYFRSKLEEYGFCLKVLAVPGCRLVDLELASSEGCQPDWVQGNVDSFFTTETV